VNSGRLSVPAFYVDSALNTPDDPADGFGGRMLPGAPMDDAPVLAGDAPGWLLNHVGGSFRLMLFVDDPATIAADVIAAMARLASGAVPVRPLVVARQAGAVPQGIDLLVDARGVATQRYDARPGTAYLLRPDQHVAARWRRFAAARIDSALARATCKEKT
jgi:3-(3-hydroxy-phenyl)propionate hydroxylase